MKTITTFILLMLCVSGFADTIPGLALSEYQRVFSDLGFPGAQVRYDKEQTEHDIRATADGNLFSLTLFGPPYDRQTIHTISAVVANQMLPEERTNELSLTFLCHVASAAYEGSTPAEARAWVAANIGKETEKMFGSVKMQLRGQGRSRILRLSTEPLILVDSGTSPAIKRLDPTMRVKSFKTPVAGSTFAEIEAEHGAPVIRDPDTGLAVWPRFKVQFKDGRAAEVTLK
jgi:hypothetical protein